MKKILICLLIALFSVFGLVSCQEETPVDPNPGQQDKDPDQGEKQEETLEQKLAKVTLSDGLFAYDGEPHTITPSGLGDDFEAVADGEVYFTEAGEYTVKYNIVEKGKTDVLKSLQAVLKIVASQDDTEADFATVEQMILKGKQNTKGQDASEEIAVTGRPNFTVPEGGYDGSKVTITFYHTMGQNLNSVLDQYLIDFYLEYPNIEVKWTQVGGYDDVRNQITTEITTGAQPNVAYCYPDHVALYNVSGSVVALDNLINSQESDGNGGILGLTEAQIEDFIPAYYNEGRQFGNGLMYSMPWSKSTEVLYYNKTFFDANGLQVPTHWFSEGENDTTSMEYVCAKIREIDPSSIPLGYDSEGNWFITMAEQMGSDYTSNEKGSSHYLFDNMWNRGMFKEFRRWYKNLYVTTQSLYGAYTSGLFTATENTKSYMSIGSSAGATHQRPAKGTDGNYPFEVGIAPIPQMNPNNPKVISQGPSVCIFNQADPQEVLASWIFVKWFTTNVAFQAEFSMASGYVPVIQSVQTNKTYKEFLDKADGYNNVAALSAKVCLEQANYYYTSPAFNGSSKARDEVGGLVKSIFSIDSEDGAEIDSKIMKFFQDAVAECKFFSGEK